MENEIAITPGFPFSITSSGSITVSGGDEAIRGKIIQVLFTAPGERVNLPDFGCGLFNLVFEPNNAILAASMEFTIGQALMHWLKDDIQLNAVQVSSENEYVLAEIVYTRRKDLVKEAVRVHFR